MPDNTRREFLRLVTVASLAAAASPRFLPSKTTSTAQAWVTSKDRRLEEVKAGDWQTFSSESPTGIVLDSTKRYQEVLGFGAAFTDASCYLLSQLEAEKRQALLCDLFGPEGLRLSVGRTCIGSSDYSRFAYSYDESTDPDPDLLRFSIEHDREYILPTLRAAEQLNPDMFLFGCQEPAELDEIQRVPVGRIDAQEVSLQLRTVFRTVPGKLCERRSEDSGGHGTERGGHGSRRKNAGRSLGPGVRD